MRRRSHTTYRIVSIIYLVLLFALMWLPLNGVGIPMDNFVLGIRIDHLIHASVYLPCVLMLMPLCRFHQRRTWMIGLLIALTTETVQWLLPYRGFDINDLIANLLGATLGLLLVITPSYKSHFMET